MKTKAFAKTIRILTIPPILVTALLILVFFSNQTVFRNTYDLAAAITCLAVIPTLAYPLQPLFPAFKDKGRSGQRSLAFITSTIGYVIGFIYAYASGATAQFKFIIVSYLLSVALLLIFNKLLKLKASGHACGVLGPLLFAVHFMGWTWAIPCVIIAIGVIWSSVSLSRHTVKELMFGGACAICAFITIGINFI